MARGSSDLVQIVIALGFGYAAYRVALTGGAGASAQKAAFDLCRSFKGVDSCCQEISGNVLLDNTSKLPCQGGTQPPGGTTTSQFTQNPRPCPDFLRGWQYVAVRADGRYEFVANGALQGIFTTKHEAEAAYNRYFGCE